jgi:hypothetical protein
MLTASQQSQHARGVFRVGRLAQDLIASDDHGVGAENHAATCGVSNRSCFIPGQPFREGNRVFSNALDLLNIRGSDYEVDTRVLQKFLSARRS